jgi:hypothetical protein|tara:strand:+ start:83 stop:376 length:294 start_codon:yes stop_codon:yes gene_type:complete
LTIPLYFKSYSSLCTHRNSNISCSNENSLFSLALTNIGLKCAISIEAEKWFEEGLIRKGEAIYDYYLILNKKVKNKKPIKMDHEWNDFVDLNLEKND